MKLKTVTFDPAESERYMMCESAKYVIWTRELLKFLGYEVNEATKCYQDSLSAIWQSKHDVKFDRNKHTILKRAFVREQYEEGRMTGTHRDRVNLQADMLTHPTEKKGLFKHIRTMGMELVPDSLGDLAK